MIDFVKQPRLDVFKAWMVKGAEFSEQMEFPRLKRAEYKPEGAIPFDKAVQFDRAGKTKYYGQWVHFYIHDYCFERIWNNPRQYLKTLKRFEGVITPDFSMYRELPLVMQMWNTYRNRAIGYWLQNNGVNVIPNVSWGDERTYGFAFEGLEKGGTVAVSTCGGIQNRVDRRYFAKGLAKMAEALEPGTIVNYSCTPDDIFYEYKERGIKVIEIENYSLTVRKAAK